jgi:hypothetical protein
VPGEIRRKCLSIGADHRVTLTHRDNVEDRERVLPDLEHVRRMFACDSFSAPLASRLVGVQGPFEKSTSSTFSANTRFRWLIWCRSVDSREVAGGPFHRLKLLAPRLQQPATDAELLRECHDVVTLLQPVHGHLSKGLWKLSHTFLRHLPPLLVPRVPICSVSI